MHAVTPAAVQREKAQLASRFPGSLAQFGALSVSLPAGSPLFLPVCNKERLPEGHAAAVPHIDVKQLAALAACLHRYIVQVIRSTSTALHPLPGEVPRIVYPGGCYTAQLASIIRSARLETNFGVLCGSAPLPIPVSGETVLDGAVNNSTPRCAPVL